MSVTIQIANLAQVRADIAAKGAAVTAAEGKAVATEVSRLVQRHFRTRDQLNPHQYPAGGRRSHFWRKAAQSVFWQSTPDAITVHASHQGVRLRYAGAPTGIKPVNAKALAIPANADSYGRLPSEIPGLRLVVFARKNVAALVQGSTKKTGQRVMFWLVKHTKPIPPDPTVLPPEHVIIGLAAHRLAVLRHLEK